VAEHWLYLPSVGFLLFLAGCFVDFPERSRRFLAAVACLFVVGLSARSVLRSSDWRSGEALFRQVIGSGGSKVRVALNLAAIYTEKGDYVKAESLLRKVLQMCPDYPVARNSLAHVLFLEGRKAEADALFVAASNDAQEARKEYPKTWVAALNVAHMRYNENRPEEALAILEKARHDYSNNWELISFQTELLRTTRGPDAALEPVEAFAHDNWWHSGAAIAIGKLRYEKGELDLAQAALRHASRLDIHDVRALNLMAVMSLNQDRMGEAYETQRQAVARQPDEPRQCLMLSDILTKMGRNEEAQAALATVTKMQALAQSEPIAN
jgi:tetratricopeptide (TPR) repeat protein